MNPIGLISTMLGAIGIIKQINRKEPNGLSSYEIGARTKTTARKAAIQSSNKIIRGLEMVRICRGNGMEFKQIGQIMKLAGYTNGELGIIVDKLNA